MAFLVVPSFPSVVGISRSKPVVILVASSILIDVGISRTERVAFLVTSSFPFVIRIFSSNYVPFLVASIHLHDTREYTCLFGTITILLRNGPQGITMDTPPVVNCHTWFTVFSRRSTTVGRCLLWRNWTAGYSQINHHLRRLSRSIFWRELSRAGCVRKKEKLLPQY